ncbi:hypothetical protein H5410_031948 [Solanum commersonii]|uniref:Uncharacterized protein n=1 Tax=Solanum commersonii TaxID=4109 RepID=A0A9J5YJP1_SOLCO|nr:hypothetical protein H5410_031948 [Solanum commersonii]
MAKIAHNQGQMIPEADYSYGGSLSPQLKRPIFMVKRAPEQIWSQLALTAKTGHCQGQTSPGDGKPSILLFFMCYSLWNFGNP